MANPPTLLLQRSTASAASGLCLCLQPASRPLRPRRPRRPRCRRLSTTTAPAPAPRPALPTDWNQFLSMRTADLPDAPPSRFTLAVKDNIATRGTDGATTCASDMLRGYASPFEATVVTQLRARGAAIVGKTNLDEFGMGSHSLYSHWGRVAAVSSSADSLSVGGSSGGSAVAVRLGDADVALGTDTGGSVRLPAAYGAVVGFKPSYGMLSRFGVVPYANSLDTVGLLAGDVAPIRQLVVGDASAAAASPETSSGGSDGGGGLWQEADTDRDPTSLSRETRLRLAAQREGYTHKKTPAAAPDRPAVPPSSPPSLQGLSFGIPLEYNIAELDPRIRAAWAAAASLLQALGATVAAVSLPSTRHALSAYYVLAPAEAASNLARYDGVRYGQTEGRAPVGAVAVSRPCGNDRTTTTATTVAAAADDDDGPVLYEGVRGAGLGREVQRRILLGAYALSSAGRDNYFMQAQRVRRRVVADFDAVFRLANPLRSDDDDAAGDNRRSRSEIGFDAQQQQQHIDLSDLPEDVPLADKRGPARVDFLLCPTAPTPAPRLSNVVAAASPVDAYINDVFTVPASLAGLPAVSIPMPMPAAAVPARDEPAADETATTCCPGLQLIGQFWDDARLLGVAETVMDAAFPRPEDREALLRHRRNGVAEA